MGYTKTRSTTGKNKLIARYLPKEVGDLLVKYLSIVRPMEAFIAEQIEGEAFDKYQKMLYTDHERAWSGRQLSETFMRQMNEWGPTATGFQEYRQLATMFMRKHLKEFDAKGDEEDRRDHQAGHNSRVAGMRYGVSTADSNEFTSDQLLAFYRASEEWHELLGFKRDGEDMKMAKTPVRLTEDTRMEDVASSGRTTSTVTPRSGSTLRRRMSTPFSSPQNLGQ